MKKISLVVQDGGGGHRVSAQALESVISDQRSDWQSERVDVYNDILGLPFSFGYNLILRLGWTRLYWPIGVTWYRWHKRLRGNAWITKLEHYWRQQQLDMVVSLIPFINRELYQSLQQVHPGIPFVILLTDLADDPPNFWLEKWQGESNLYVICPTRRATDQALTLGYPQSQIFETSGVILHPRFYQAVTNSKQFNDTNQAEFGLKKQIEFDRAIERKKSGLDPELPTGVLLFGGQGANIMLQIAQSLENAGLTLQLIFLCGENHSLANQLRHLKHRQPWLIQDFTDNVPYFLSLADFLIGKPGPASLSEAITLNLPVITICNSSTLWHEQYNAQWIQEEELGIVIEDFEEIEHAVTTMIEPQTFARYQTNVRSTENQAIFEVVDILDEILNKG